MAEVEDYADFGSHFLDSMLEVEMTEEDAELDVSATNDPQNGSFRELPPIPTFDLQTETFTYKDIFRNAMGSVSALQPVSAIPPLQAMQPGPMLTIHSRELMNPSILTTTNTIISKPTFQTIVQNPIVQNPNIVINANTSSLVKNTQAAVKQVNNVIKTSAAKASPSVVNMPTGLTPEALLRAPTISTQALKTEILKEVFKAEYVKNVFKKQEPPHDMAEISEEEMTYYNTTFKDVSKVAYCRLHCTICDKHMGCSVDVQKRITVHNMLKVLTCKPCYEFYGDGNFPCDEVDNCEIYCRWCGQGGALVCCSFCPRVFCKKCVRRNYGNNFLRCIERASDWACFCCAQKPLWPHRAICRALIAYIASKKARPGAPKKDTSICCDLSPAKRRRSKPSPLKPVTTAAQVPVKSVSKDKSIVLGSTQGKKMIVPYLRDKKITDQNKSPAPTIKLTTSLQNSLAKLPGITAVPRSGILRISNSTPQLVNKNVSNITLPQSIQSPVYHGQTLITPPATRQLGVACPQPSLVPPSSKPSPAAGTPRAPSVRISFSTQIPSSEVSRIPVVKIPHNAQGMILRLNFPDNKTQSVRLVTDNSCCGIKGFTIPEFKGNDHLDYLESTLENSLKLTKIIYDRLIILKDKVGSKTKITQKSVYNSTVNKLHSLYEKSQQLLKELDEEVLKNHEKWQNQSLECVDVIDLSDDESSKNVSNKPKRFRRSNKFEEKAKEFFGCEDSDIEIIEETPTDPLAVDSVENNVTTEVPAIQKNSSSEQETDSVTKDVKKSNSRIEEEIREKYKIKEFSIDLVKLPSVDGSVTGKRKRSTPPTSSSKRTRETENGGEKQDEISRRNEESEGSEGSFVNIKNEGGRTGETEQDDLRYSDFDRGQNESEEGETEDGNEFETKNETEEIEINEADINVKCEDAKVNGDSYGEETDDDEVVNDDGDNAI